MTNNNNPWGALDAATGQNQLYLDPGASQAVNNAFPPYESALQTLINNALDDTTGYFGTSEGNPLARILEEAFNQRGKALTDYLKEQLAQTEAFLKTARDAATALQANEGN
jgi:predicted ribosome quality control (RQC) complex YloA/Tae2 family protein